LKQALEAGYAALQKPGATSLDGVETAIRVLEDDIWFKRGARACSRTRPHELDASILRAD